MTTPLPRERMKALWERFMDPNKWLLVGFGYTCGFFAAFLLLLAAGCR